MKENYCYKLSRIDNTAEFFCSNICRGVAKQIDFSHYISLTSSFEEWLNDHILQGDAGARVMMRVRISSWNLVASD